MTGIGPVVVGVDGSDSSQSALVHGAWEADRRGAVLRLVHSHRVTVPYATIGLAPDPAELTAEITAVREMLADQQLEARTAYPHLQVEASLVAGSPGAALVEESRDASLVVVGCRGLGGFTGLLLGSVSAQLTAHSYSPVIVIRPPSPQGNLGAGPPPLPVVVGIDGIPDSQGAVGFAFEQAAARSVPLIALYAWWMGPVAGLSPDDESRYDLTEAEEEARRMLAEAVAGWQATYPDVKVELRPARALNPTLALTEASKDAGLLVVSRHGGNALTRLLLGSIGDLAVRQAPCPVAVVPEQTTEIGTSSIAT